LRIPLFFFCFCLIPNVIMPPKLKPMAPSSRPSGAPSELQEIVVGNVRVGPNGSTFASDVEGVPPPSVNIDDLEKRRQLGEGKQGTVSQYVQKSDRTISYAVKKISIPSTTDPKSMQSIASELRNIFTVSNEYTIKLYNAFYRNHSLYLVMEYMDWGSLEELCCAKERPRLSEAICAYVASQVLHCLALLHKKHVVAGNVDGRETRQIHRDIKPANVLLSCDGRVKLADFGVAANADTVGAVSFVGTATYMSPERIRGGKYGPSSDVWSVGVMITELLTGEYPFQDSCGHFMTLLRAVTNFVGLDLSKYELSDDAVFFINACMRNNEDERLTAEELLNVKWIVENESRGRDELKALLDTIGDAALHRANTSLTTNESPH